MASPPTIDLAALLAPIPGDNPAGVSLRYDATYDTIQEARREEEALEQGDWKRDTKTADWPQVITLASDALANKSKDLQIASWLLEALIKRRSFPGLRDGLRLIRELQEQFWDTLHPAIEDGDLEYRAAPVNWLNEKLPQSVRALPITGWGKAHEYSWFDFKESRDLDNLARKSPELAAQQAAEGKISGEEFDAAVAACSRADYEALFSDLTECHEEIKRLDEVVDQKFGKEAPSLLALRKAIEECREVVDVIVKKKRELEPDAVIEGTGVGGEVTEGAPLAASLAGGSVPLEPRSRAEALQRLAAVAAYFRRTEPHSPVSYLVSRAVKWGDMPLEDWLREVIADVGVLTQLRETLGIKDADGGGS